MEQRFENFMIIPPVPGSCTFCAKVHDPGEPHERDSLYYQYIFFKENKRMPTWEDAMAHCSDQVKKDFMKRLEKRGIYIEPN